MGAHLTVEQRRLARRLRAMGLSLREIGSQVGCSHQGVALVAPRRRGGPFGGMARCPARAGCRWPTGRRSRWGCMPGSPSPRSPPGWGKRPRRCRGRWPLTAAGTGIGRGGRIIAPGSGPGGPTSKLAYPPLAAGSAWLAEWWSPVQISARLRIEFPGDPMMQVSHETIYQALYVQGHGELRGNWPLPPAGRAKRQQRGRGDRGGQLRDMVMISDGSVR